MTARPGSSSPRDAKILVTGASGFVGKYLCDALHSRGWTVRALARGRPATQLNLPYEQVYGDVCDRPAMVQALRAMDVVIHLAGRAHVLSETAADPLSEFRSVNVGGTRTVLGAAVETGVKTFVHMSSLGAVAAESSETVSDRSTPDPTTPYGVSKLESERVVSSISDDNGMEYYILRPPMIYGPGMKGNPLKLFELVDKGVPLPFGAIENRRSILYVGNLSAAINAILSRRPGPSGTFLIADENPLSTAALVRLIARALGRPDRLLPIPPSLLGAIGKIGDAVSAILPFPVTSEVLSKVCGSLVVDYTPLATRIGYQPAYSTEQGIAETAKWYSTR